MTLTALKKAPSHRQGSARFPRRCLPVRSTSPLTMPLSTARTGEKVILVRLETSPEDIEGMHCFPGHPDRSRRHDLSRGRCGPWHGHAAAVVRLRRHAQFDEEAKTVTIDGKAYPRGRLHLPGRLHRQRVRRRRSRPWKPPSPATSAASWAGPTRSARLQVRTNADTPRDTEQARDVRRRGHRPVPYRAHVLRGRTVSRPCAR